MGAYFDGKGWENEFGQKYGIRSIPSMWLVDKKGNLVDMEARGSWRRRWRSCWGSRGVIGAIDPEKRNESDRNGV